MTPEQKEIKRQMSSRVNPKVQNWLTPEGLALLEGLSRDGYSMQDIAHKMNISGSTLGRWREDHEAIDVALRHGREIADYMVESALFKSALGYRTKEVSIQTKLENGIATEVTKDVKFRDQAPNMRAIEVWLYNRKPDLWKRDGGSRLDDIIEDSSIQITVNRGNPDLDNKKDKKDNWQEEVNDDITIQKPSNQKQSKQSKSKKQSKAKANIDIKPKDEDPNRRKSNFDEYNKQRKINMAMPSDNIHVDKQESLSSAIEAINHINLPLANKNSLDKGSSNTSKPNDVDEWPDNWQELINTVELETMDETDEIEGE